METFRFAIVVPADAESLKLLRELSNQMARAAGLDERGARRAGDELVETIETRTQRAGKNARLNVSFERREEAGPVDVEVTAAASGGSPGSGNGAGAGDHHGGADVRRSWSAT